MGVRFGIVVVLVSLYFMCTWDPEQGQSSGNENAANEVPGPWVESADRGIHYVNIIQRSCALEVVHRVDVLAGPLVLDRFADMNLKDQETKQEEPILACVKAPSVADDGSGVNVLQE